jgi:hypothetical protein
MRGCKIQCEGPKVVARLKQGMCTLQCYKSCRYPTASLVVTRLMRERNDLGGDIWCNKVQALTVTEFKDDMR